MVLNKQLRVIGWKNIIKVFDYETNELLLSGTSREILQRFKTNEQYKDAFIKSINIIESKDKISNAYLEIKVKLKAVKSDVSIKEEY